jgi:hypothetical protein
MKGFIGCDYHPRYSVLVSVDESGKGGKPIHVDHGGDEFPQLCTMLPPGTPVAAETSIGEPLQTLKQNCWLLVGQYDRVWEEAGGRRWLTLIACFRAGHEDVRTIRPSIQVSKTRADTTKCNLVRCGKMAPHEHEVRIVDAFSYAGDVKASRGRGSRTEFACSLMPVSCVFLSPCSARQPARYGAVCGLGAGSAPPALNPTTRAANKRVLKRASDGEFLRWCQTVYSVSGAISRRPSESALADSRSKA